ncbi:putative reverse transcriptase domain-containing protein [Tanacetum coccineum]
MCQYGHCLTEQKILEYSVCVIIKGLGCSAMRKEDPVVFALMLWRNITWKANVVADALSRKERVKPRRVREMSMTIQSSIKDKLLASQYEASKEENAPAEMLCGLDQQMEKKEDGVLYFMDRIWVPSIGDVRTIIMDEVYAMRSGWTVYVMIMANFVDSLGTRLDMSTAYHPQTDGQSERTIQNLEDMLRACEIDFGGSWDTHLPLGEFSYNNSYHSSIRCGTFEVLYGRKCSSPVLLAEVEENQLIGLEMVKETTDKVVLIRERLKAARDRQKSYADNRRKPLEFEEGDHVLLKVSPWKGVIRFRKKGKLAPRYVGRFEILETIGPVAYRLRLPQELNGVHDTFHVSN